MYFPYGGLSIQDGGAQTQALTTTMAKMTAWNAALGAKSAADSNTIDGDPAVVPDVVNSRVKVNCPGIYLVMVDISGTGGGTADVIVQIRKNLLVVADGAGRFGVGTARANCAFQAIVKVTSADLPTTGIATMAATSTTGFAGASGAPTTETTIDVALGTVASTVTITLEDAHLTVIRLG